MDWDLLEKTTFWIEDIELNQTNLSEVASITARQLELEPQEVMVVDVRPGLVAFDILRQKVKAEAITAKGDSLLKELAKVPGIKMGENAMIHSEGVLGFIALDPKQASEVLRASSELTDNIIKVVSKRAIVFASGAEVIAEKIEDTNSPYILEELARKGFNAKFGGILEDNYLTAANVLEQAVEEGYGLIITTGGVGAEDKDYSIEALLKLDPQAHTPWILKFTPDHKRHHKEGVRIAVGQTGIARLVALPGPHEEAKLGCQKLLEAMAQGLNTKETAELIAAALRNRWRNAMREGGKSHELSRNS